MGKRKVAHVRPPAGKKHTTIDSFLERAVVAISEEIDWAERRLSMDSVATRVVNSQKQLLKNHRMEPVLWWLQRLLLRLLDPAASVTLLPDIIARARPFLLLFREGTWGGLQHPKSHGK